MKRPRLRGRWPWLGLLLVPALAWAVVLALVPTEWARARLVDRLAAATGRSVRIGALRLGCLRQPPDPGPEPRRAVDARPTPGSGWPRPGSTSTSARSSCGHCEPGRDRGRRRLGSGSGGGRTARPRSATSSAAARPAPAAAAAAASARPSADRAEGPGRERPGRRRAERHPVRPDRGRGRGDLRPGRLVDDRAS